MWAPSSPLTHPCLSPAQVPYETLNKRFRAAQKNIDRETSHVTMVVAELEKTLSSCPAVDSVVSLLDGVVEKLSVLKRKVSVASGPSCRAVAWVRGPGLTVYLGCPKKGLSPVGTGTQQRPGSPEAGRRALRARARETEPSMPSGPERRRLSRPCHLCSLGLASWLRSHPPSLRDRLSWLQRVPVQRERQMTFYF